MNRFNFLLFIFSLCINVFAQQIYYVDATNTPPGSGTVNDPWSGFADSVWNIDTLPGSSTLVPAGML